MTPALFVLNENHESFGFFQFGAEKEFPAPDSMKFVWGGVGRAPVQCMQFSAIFAMLAVLATSVTPCYQLSRVCLGML